MTHRKSTATRRPGAMSVIQFVMQVVDSHGKCDEGHILAYIQDAYKKEHILRAAALRGKKKPSELASRFINGDHVTGDELDKLYSAGLKKILNQIRFQATKAARDGCENGVVFDSDTQSFRAVGSRAAAVPKVRVALKKLGQKQLQILRLLESLDGGLTDKEIQTQTGMNADTQRPRRGELVKLGLVVKIGKRKAEGGKTVSVWAAVKAVPHV